MMQVDSIVGMRIADRWVVDEPIARGGMSTVYRAFDDIEGGVVAVKVLRLDLKPELRSPERFRREARAASRLAHPNVIPIRAHGELASGQGYLILDYLDGVGLHAAIHHQAPFGVRRVLHIGAQIADALAHAHHHQVLHRDLKPGNILLIHQPDRPDRVQVLDFGLAKIQDFKEADTLTRAGMVFGTPEYMAPEQAVGSEMDGRCDLYALGAIIFEMLTGRPPFKGKNAFDTLRQQVSEPAPHLGDVRPDLEFPSIVERIVMRCLEKPPENRFDSAAQLARALKAVNRQLAAPKAISEPIDVTDSQVPTLGGDRAILLDPHQAAQAEHHQLKRHRQETLQRIAALLNRLPMVRGATEILDEITENEQRSLDHGAALAVVTSAHEEARAEALQRISQLRVANIDRQMEATRLREELAERSPDEQLHRQLEMVADELQGLEQSLYTAERELAEKTATFETRRHEFQRRIDEVEALVDQGYDELAILARQAGGQVKQGEMKRLLEDLDSFEKWIAAKEAILGEMTS